MNKTTILSFILDEVALKFRNVSTNMRKRIHWMLTLKKITVREYDERALILNGWIRVGKDWTDISKVEEMKKGVSNYYLETQEQVDKLVTLNNEVRCYSYEFKPTDPIEIKQLETILIDQDNYEAFSESSFIEVKYLILDSLLTDQIKFILKRIKKIDILSVYCSFLQTIDFTESKIKEFEFNCISFEEPVYLPRQIVRLQLDNCTSPNLIKAQRVNEIDFSSSQNKTEEYKELAKSLKGVKAAEFSNSLMRCLINFSSQVREIRLKAEWDELETLGKIHNRFPYLIYVPEKIQIKALDEVKLRTIDPIMVETDEKFKLRPRKIIIHSKNVDQLNNHPELFEKVECVCVDTYKLNFDILPRRIKKIKIYNGGSEESAVLNRF